jgi:hypothetical protein
MAQNVEAEPSAMRGSPRSDAAHTPGPWMVSGVRRKWQEPGARHVNDAHAILAGPSEEVVALVLYDPRQHGLCWADARLIAAARDLLEAAREGLIVAEADVEARERVIEEWGLDPDADRDLGIFRSRRDLIAAAIAKATGEA